MDVNGIKILRNDNPNNIIFKSFEIDSLILKEKGNTFFKAKMYVLAL